MILSRYTYETQFVDLAERMDYMEEQTRKKYEFLLSGQEEAMDFKTGKQPDIQDGGNEFIIGHLLRRARLWKKLTLQQVARGICKKNTLERLEKEEGEIFSGFDRHFLLRSLLNRMGMFAGKFEFYYDGKERQKENLRAWLVNWRENLEIRKRDEGFCKFPETGEDGEATWIPKEKHTEFLEKLRLPENASYEAAIDAYADIYHVEWECVWVLWQKRIRALSQDELPEEARRTWEELFAQKLFYIQEEWEFLYALAEYFKRKKEYKITEEIYGKMYQNAVKPGMDDERQLELLPGFCRVYGKFLWERNGNGSCGEIKPEDILIRGIWLNLKFRRMYSLYDLMETYCSVLYGRLSDPSKENLRKKGKNNKKNCGTIENFVEEVDLKEEKERKIVAELLQYEQYLVALEIAQ